ncbi:translocation/assembly module TamB domain-containing protein [Maritalea mediterranea]|uniref:Translocation/assembly module TamB domain-containing protein n=1 Tax=Maritalea mediterranea TaxID=2909667 RepID=A0ABS9EAP5_9HYPH|nr:translocation/assembly module TamB domain-containing protein [Maritalea mediterranea]MCF4099264.1 translocation/assembly module TamB domain-containing protein [Maritalea mediterranea]
MNAIKKWTWRITLSLAVAVVLVLGAVSFLLLTSTGRDITGNFIANSASTDAQQVEITGVQQVLGDKLRIDKVQLSDAEGVWAEIEGVHVDYQLRQLISRHVVLDRLAVAKVHIYRLPIPDETQDAAPTTFDLPEQFLPDPLRAAVIDDISIDEIVLDEPVLGTTRRLALSGNLAAQNVPLNTRGELQLISLDRDAPILMADWRIEPAENGFGLNLAIDEPGEGLFADLIDIPGRPAFAARIATNGPLSNLNADLSASLDGREAVKGALVVSLADDQQGVQAELVGKLAPFMPDMLVPFVAGQSQLNVDAVRKGNNTFGIKSARFRSTLTRIDAQGTYAADTVDLSLNGQFGDAETEVAFSPDGETEVRLGAVNLQGQLKGALKAASLKIGGRVAQLNSADISVDAAEFSANADNFDLAAMQGKVAINAKAAAVQVQNPQIDPLLAGPVELSTDLAFSTNQVRFDNLTIESAALAAQGQGIFQPDTQNIAAELTAKIAGQDDGLYGQLFANGPADIEVRLVRDGQRLAAERLVVGSGNLNADLAAALTVEGIAANGSVGFTKLAAFDPRLEGQVKLGVEASGALNNPQVKLQLASQGVQLEGEPLDDLTGTIEGALNGGITLALNATYRQSPVEVQAEYIQQSDGRQLLRNVTANVPGGRAEGAITIADDGLLDGSFTLDIADLKELAPLLLQDGLAGDLTGKLVLEAVDGQQNLQFEAASDELSLATAKAQNVQLSAQASDLFDVPFINASARVENVLAANERVSDVQFDVRSEGQTYPFVLQAVYEGDQMRATGNGALNADGFTLNLEAFSGRYQNVPLELVAAATLTPADGGFRLALPGLRVGAGRVSANGQVGEQLDVDAQLTDFPLNLIENFVSTGQAIEGNLSASASITGSASSPRVEYRYQANGFSVALSRSNQLSALNLSGTGTLIDNRLSMENDIQGGGASARANGAINLATNGLNIDVAGQLPFEYLAQPLSRAGIRLTGAASINAQLGGSTAVPRYQGQITTSGARLTDVASNITVSNISGNIALNNDRAQVTSLTGTIGGGGQLSISGQTSLRPSEDLQSDYDIRVRNGSYEDGTISTQFSADLRLAGPLATGGSIGGVANIDQASITIPEQLGGGVSPVEIQHRGASGAVQKQAADLAPKPSASGGAGGGMNLDIQVNAPRRIYVRGRGVDAELGGQLRILGTTGNPSPSGQISLLRGRVDLLTKRFDFDTGQVTFRGSMDPALNFSANTRSDGYIYSIIVQGFASAPEFFFQSSPSLPHDEVVANLFFGKSLGELSPLQIAQLANAIATLNGSNSGPGLLDRLRSLAGVDNIDIKSNEQGETTVGIGGYLNDRTYVNVEKGTKAADDKVTIDLDITDSLKARGETAGDGRTEAGIFYERDY